MTQEEIERAAAYYADNDTLGIRNLRSARFHAFLAGAAFTQPEWHYVERDGLPTFTGTYQISFEVQGLLGSSGTDVQEADFNAQLNEWLNWPEEFKIYAWRFIKPPPLKP